MLKEFLDDTKNFKDILDVEKSRSRHGFKGVIAKDPGPRPERAGKCPGVLYEASFSSGTEESRKTEQADTWAPCPRQPVSLGTSKDPMASLLGETRKTETDAKRKETVVIYFLKLK